MAVNWLVLTDKFTYPTILATAYVFPHKKNRQIFDITRSIADSNRETGNWHS